MLMMLYFYKEYQNACHMIKISVDWNLFHTINLLEGKGQMLYRIYSIIKFLVFPVWRLFKGGIYSRAAFISKSLF